MGQFVITYPDDKGALIADSFDAEFPGRTDAGLTKPQWVKQQLIEYTRQVVRNNQGNVAAGVARKASDDTINAIQIT